MTPSPRNRRTLPAAAIAALLLAAAAPPAGARNYGRETGAHEIVTTVIVPASDRDAFVFDAAPGWRLSAVARRQGRSDLEPVLELLVPDGSVATEEVAVRARSKSARLRAELRDGGRYALRVSSAAGEGEVRLRFKLKQGPARRVRVKRDPLEPGAERSYPFAAVDGALLSWKLKARGEGTPQVARILDPAGREIPFDPDRVVPNRHGEKATAVPVTGPGGLYALVVRNGPEAAEATLTLKVKLPREKRARVTLGAREPRLDGVDPAAGGYGVPVALSGANLDVPPARVLVGGAPAEAVDGDGGGAATVTPPEGEGTVDLVWVNRDGQVAALPGGFTYFPPPVVQSFTPTEGPLEGGRLLTLQGDGFRASEQGHYRVLLREGEATEVTVEGPATLACRTPPGFAGGAVVRVVDRYSQSGYAATTYTYRAAPALASVAPGAVPASGGVEVTVAGQGFRSDDELLLDGVPVDSEPVLFQGGVVAHRFTAGAHAPGSVAVAVRDRYGQEGVREEGLAYFRFTDVTADALPGATATDDWGGVSTAAVDRDGDGVLDRLVVAHGSGLSATRPGTRVLENDGSGTFTDATASVMPSPSGGEAYGAGTVLAGDLNGDGDPDLYLGRGGSGAEARVDSAASNFVIPWGRILHAAGDGSYADQPTTGSGARFAITGTPHCDICGTGPRCYLYDYDFRSVAAAMGDMDGDLDPDVVLVNDASLVRFQGTGTYAIYVGCKGGVQWSGYTSTPYGSALRILSSGSSGGLTDRTATALSATFTAADDFRGAAVAVADLDGDFLRDVVVTHDGGLEAADGSPLPATRAFRQRNTGSSVTFSRIGGFLPAPSEGEDDWRGDAVAVADLDNDLRGDLVIAVDGSPPAGASLATRILVQDPGTGRLVDRTGALLGGVLPEGDDGRAAAILARDLDRDGDADLLLSAPGDPGTGGRRTRLLLNGGRDPSTGLPRFLDASAILPDPSLDPGAAVAVQAADIDGDGDLDLLLTDTHRVSGSPVRRTRVWRQDR